MDTEIERRIYECINGVELEKGPVTTELMSKRISIKQFLTVYRPIVIEVDGHANFLKAGNILITLTQVFAHNLDRCLEQVHKFFTTLQKIVHLSTHPVPESSLPAAKRVSIKKKFDRENLLDTYDDLCPHIGKRINDRVLKDDNGHFKIVRAGRAPSLNIPLKSNYVPSKVYNCESEGIANKRDLKVWAYLCDRPVPQPQVCYPCAHHPDHSHDTFVEDSQIEILDTSVSGMIDISDHMEVDSHMSTAFGDTAIQDDNISLMNSTIRSDEEMDEPSNLVVCELGPTDDDILEEEGSEQQTFADWINEFTKHTMANLPDDRMHKTVNDSVRSLSWKACTEQASKYESKLRAFKEDLTKKDSIDEDELLGLFGSFREFLPSELKCADAVWNIIKLTFDVNVKYVKRRKSTLSTSSSAFIDEATELNESEHLEEIEDLEDRFSGNVDDGFVGFEEKEEEKEKKHSVTDTVFETGADIEEHLEYDTHDTGDETFHSVPATVDESYNQPVETQPVETDESVLSWINKKVQEWHEYLAPFIKEIQSQTKKVDVPAYSKKIMSTMASDNTRNVLPLKDVLESHGKDDYPFMFVSVLHMTNNKQVQLDVSIPDKKDFVLDTCDVTIINKRTYSAMIVSGQSEVPEKRRC